MWGIFCLTGDLLEEFRICMFLSEQCHVDDANLKYVVNLKSYSYNHDVDLIQRYLSNCILYIVLLCL